MAWRGRQAPWLRPVLIGAAAMVLAALGLAFFKLSIGMGTMTTYGSYIGKKENMPSRKHGNVPL